MSNLQSNLGGRTGKRPGTDQSVGLTEIGGLSVSVGDSFMGKMPVRDNIERGGKSSILREDRRHTGLPILGLGENEEETPA